MDPSPNLLPTRLTEARRERAKRQVRLAWGAVAVVPLTIAYIVIIGQTGILRARADRLDQEIAPLRPKAALVVQLEAERTSLQQREQVYERVRSNIVPWSMIMGQVSALVPTDIWFTNMGVANQQLTVEGAALSETAVASLASRLAAARFVSGVSVAYIREAAATGPR